MSASTPKGAPDARKFIEGNRAISAAELTQPQPKAALDYWQSKLNGRIMPSPADIDPAEISRLLAHVSLIDVLDEAPLDFYFRIEGETVRMVLGQKRMGKRLSELKDKLGPAYPLMCQFYSSIVVNKVPVFAISNLKAVARSFYEIEAVYLPLSRDGLQVDRILFCMGVVVRPDDNVVALPPRKP